MSKNKGYFNQEISNLRRTQLDSDGGAPLRPSYLLGFLAVILNYLFIDAAVLFAGLIVLPRH